MEGEIFVEEENRTSTTGYEITNNGDLKPITRTSPYKRLGNKENRTMKIYKNHINCGFCKQNNDRGMRNERKKSFPREKVGDKSEEQTKLYTKAKYVNMRQADRETLPGPGEVGEMTNEEIKKKYQRKYPEVPDDTYNVLITPVRKPIGLKHLTSAFYMMKEYEGAEDGTLKRHLLTLSLTHQKVFELVRDGVK